MDKKGLGIEKPKIIRNRDAVPKGAKIIDTTPSAIKELAVIRNPEIKLLEEEEYAKALKDKISNIDIENIYIYFPWNNIAVCTVEEDAYLELRTSRNRDIITIEEQRKYRDSHIGIVGLSVGSNVLNALVFSGGSKKIKIADYDLIETTNLNRLRAPLYVIGENKAVYAARQVWELDPFAELEVWEKGTSKENIEEFILNPRLDIFVDEMDSLDLKIKSRLVCRENNIPVIMVTDNGDNIILDIERFDEDPERPILHGLVDEIDFNNLENIPYSEWLNIATKIVNPKNLTPRMVESLQNIGKTISAVPQLGTTATIAGAAAAYAIRKITNNEEMPSGRYTIGLDALNKTL